MKLINNEAKKLIDNIRKYRSLDIAHKIALGIDLPVNPTPIEKSEWVNHISTKTWCYCTVGYNKEIFEYVFNCEVDIELLESIKMGDHQCLMKIIPLSKKE